MMRDALVRVFDSPVAAPVDKIVVGLAGCACIHLRYIHSDDGDLLEVAILRNLDVIEMFVLTPAEQTRLKDAFKRLKPSGA